MDRSTPLTMNAHWCANRLPTSIRSWMLAVLVGVSLASNSRLLGVEPSVKYIFPAGGQRGTTVEFRVGGHYFHGAASFEMVGDGIVSCDRVTETETIWFEGPMIFKPFSQQAEDYPKDHRGAVRIDSDAELGVRFWQAWTSQGVTPGRPFVVGDLPEIVEREIDGHPIPVKIHLPVTINGRIFPREDVDIWEFDATAGEKIRCEVVAERIQSPLDSRIEIRSPDGKRVAENVDFFGTDSFLVFEVQQTGTHQVCIHDIRYAGLQDYIYRLSVTKGDDRQVSILGSNTPKADGLSDESVPAFQLELPTDGLNVIRGQTAKLKITASRTGGFAEPIKLVVNGLPAGIQVKNTEIGKDKNEVELEFFANDNSKIATSKIQIQGQATIDGKAVTSVAELHRPMAQTNRDLRLSVCMPTPFKMDGLAFATNFVSRGTLHYRHYVIDRGGFQGSLRLAPADKQIRHQQGVTGLEMEIPPGVTEVDYPIRLPTWLEMDRTGRTVLMLVGTVQDKDGSEHICSYTSSATKDQIVTLTAPCPMGVSTERASYAARPNSVIDIPIHVSRGHLASNDVRVHAVIPRHFEAVSANSISIPKGQDAGVLSFRLGQNPGPFNTPVVVRATMQNKNGDDVYAETKFEFASSR